MIGIGWINFDFGTARVLVFIKHPLERLSAVGGAKDPAFLVGAIGMAEYGDEQAIRVARVDGNLGNLLAIAQSKMGPGLASVSGFVNAVADREIGPLQTL